MTLSIQDDIILGVTHFSINGELVRIYRCPFCSFKNIHEDEITHHIRYKEDFVHDVDVDKLDKNRYITSICKSRYHYEKKEDLPLPEIQCPWCDYKDKIERDLERHILDNRDCRIRLYKLKVEVGERLNDPVWTREPFSWMYDNNDYDGLHDNTEYRLYKAMKLARRKSGMKTKTKIKI
jgi:hypothetical protein